MIEVPCNVIIIKLKIDTLKIVVKDLKSSKQIPFQLEKKGSNKIANMLVQVSLTPYQQNEIIISTGKSTPFPTKVYGRYVPERKDDFAWGNDKIAFRMYGKALELTPKENA